MSDERTVWGLCPWFEERGVELVHANDLDALRALAPAGRLFRALGEEGGWLRLGCGGVVVRVHASLFVPVTAMVHDVGEPVVLADGRRGEVVEVRWHHARAEPMYRLRVDGTVRSKRYWNADLRAPDRQSPP